MNYSLEPRIGRDRRGFTRQHSPWRSPTVTAETNQRAKVGELRARRRGRRVASTTCAVVKPVTIVGWPVPAGSAVHAVGGQLGGAQSSWGFCLPHRKRLRKDCDHEGVRGGWQWCGGATSGTPVGRGWLRGCGYGPR